MEIIPGTQGAEKVYYQPLTNEIMDQGQVDERREWLAGYPRKLAKFDKTLVPARAVWTWKEQRSRFSPYETQMVKTDLRYECEDGSEI